MKGTFIVIALCTLISVAEADSKNAEFPPLQVLYVVDWQAGKILRFEDHDYDGDYDDAGEATDWYDESLGTFSLVGSTGLAIGSDGTIYCAAIDRILAFIDVNADGDCNDPGEHSVFFDGNPSNNAGGLWMSYASDLFWDAAGRMWVSSASMVSQPFSYDAVFVLEDLNGDGSANDALEAIEFFRRDQGPGTQSADVVPRDVVFGRDGRVYYLEGSFGALDRGIHVLDDVDGNGVIDPLFEARPFFIPPPAAQGEYEGIAQATDGSWYVGDSTSDVIWRGTDDDKNGMVETAEVMPWGGESGGHAIRKVQTARDGSVYALQGVGSTHLVQVFDLDSDGVLEEDEVRGVFHSDLAGVELSSPRGLVLDPNPVGPILAFCLGDGSGSPCPCGNDVGLDTLSGCVNHTGTGAALETLGTPSISRDDLCFQLEGATPNSFTVLVSGDNALPQSHPGVGLQQWDGLRCVGGNLLRHGNRATDANGRLTLAWGASTDPLGTIVSQGAFGSGQTRLFQAFYRTNALTVCQTGKNTTNGVRVFFLP